MNDNTTVRIEVPESVTLRMNELLVESGTELRGRGGPTRAKKAS